MVRLDPIPKHMSNSKYTEDMLLIRILQTYTSYSSRHRDPWLTGSQLTSIPDTDSTLRSTQWYHVPHPPLLAFGRS